MKFEDCKENPMVIETIDTRKHIECDECGKNIYEGDDYYSAPVARGGQYVTFCPECMKEWIDDNWWKEYEG